MIHSIVLKNFKQHRNLKVTLETGLNIIQGENGAGKSNIMKAILYALFGTEAAGAKEHLTSWDADGGMQVKLMITLPSSLKVEVTRSLTKAEVNEGDKLLASGQTAVTRFIEDQFGMDRKLFASMLYSEQGNTQALLTMGPTGLQKQLEQVANIDVVDKVINAVAKDENIALGEIKGLGETENINALEEAVAELAATVGRNEAICTGLEQEVAHYSSVVSIAQDEFKAASATKVQQATLSSREQGLRARMELLQEQKAEHDKDPIVNTVRPDVEWIRSQMEATRTEMQTGQLALSRYEVALANYNRVKSDYEDALIHLPLIKEVTRLSEVITQKRDAQSEAAMAFHKAEQAESTCKCQTCNRPFEDADAEQLALNTAEAKASHLLAIEEVTLAVDALCKATATFSLPFLKTKSAIIDGYVEPDVPVPAELTQEDLDALSEKVKGLALQLTHATTLEAQVSAWTRRNITLVDGLRDAQQQLAPLQTALQELNVITDQELQALGDKLTDLRNVRDMRSNALTHAIRERDQNQLRLSQVNANRTQAIEKQAKVDQLRTRTALLTELLKYLRSNRSKLMGDTWTSLMQYTSHLIQLTTEGHMHSLTRDEAGAFNIIEDGKEVPVRELSGAEKSIVGLCLRISLARVFYGDSGFTLLDESTADCREVNAARVAGMLQGLQSQVIMISHRSGDAVNAANQITIE